MTMGTHVDGPAQGRVAARVPGRSALVLCVAIVALSVQGVALAQEFCSQPITPYCADKDSSFDSKVQVDRCEKDLSSYEKDLARYEQCIKHQLQTLHKRLTEAHQRLDKAKKNLQASSD